MVWLRVTLKLGVSMEETDSHTPHKLSVQDSLSEQSVLLYLEKMFRSASIRNSSRCLTSGISGTMGSTTLEFSVPMESMQEWTRTLCYLAGVSMNDQATPNRELVVIRLNGY